MTDRAREVLNALLGLDRDTYRSTNAQAMNEDVCKYMLASFCPFVLFQNTRRNIGKCKYMNHEEYYRIEYARRGSIGIEMLEWELVRLLVEIVLHVEREIGTEEPEVISDSSFLEKVKEMEEEFNQRFEAIGKSGMSGNVEEALAMAMECEEIKVELEKVKEAYFVKNNGLGMERCKTCGARLTPSDTDAKVDKHIGGRLHRGHMLVRSKLAELLQKFKVSSITEIFPEGISFKYIGGRSS